jgi:hypothetical protein
MECMVLLMFRGIYFFLLGSGVVVAGGLVDFALIEIPTFIYIGIFLQILVVAYWIFFKLNKLSTTHLLGLVMFAMLVNWLIFAAIMIAISLTETPSSAPKWCDCQISYPPQQSDTAQIVRIVYKSAVLIISFCVVVITVGYGIRHIKWRNQSVFFQVLILSLGLFFDCVAFLIYYTINSPSAYFVIVLWFTELFSICFVNVLVAKNYISYEVKEKWTNATTSKRASQSIQSLKEGGNLYVSTCPK